MDATTVAVEFTIKGVQGTSQDDADADAYVLGSDHRLYSSSLDTLVNCTDFNYGQWTVEPGTVASGCVSFQLPDGVHVVQVQWNPDVYSPGGRITWFVLAHG